MKGFVAILALLALSAAAENVPPAPLAVGSLRASLPRSDGKVHDAGGVRATTSTGVPPLPTRDELLLFTDDADASNGGGAAATAPEDGPFGNPSHTSKTVALLITTFLLFMSGMFEQAKGTLERHAGEAMAPVVEALFGELTVMGFMSLVTSLIQKANVLTTLSGTLYPGNHTTAAHADRSSSVAGKHKAAGASTDEHDQVGEVFEQVHMIIFFVQPVAISAEHFLQIERGALHGYGPDPHSRGVCSANPTTG